MKPYIEELRIKSWLKNIIVFIPLVFSHQLFNTDKLLETVIAFIAFCLVSSAVYVINDISDAKKDALHPVKRFRPIASGKITIGKAAAFAAVLSAAGISVSFGANILTLIFTAVYMALNLAYTMQLKRIPLIDCFCIAVGFVVRVYAGGAASGEPVSDWLFLTIVAMSLFMAFGKRRGEMLKVGAEDGRPVLGHYDLAYLNGIVFVCAGLSVVFYSLWAMDSEMYMIYTVPIVIFIVCRYLLLIHGTKSHADPTEVIFTDKTFLIACGIYVIITIALLYSGSMI